MFKDKYYNTQVEKIGSIHYCEYCGEEAVREEEYYDRDSTYYYHCNCEVAQLERIMNLEIEDVKKKYSGKLIRNPAKLKEIRYNLELKMLNSKYNKK